MKHGRRSIVSWGVDLGPENIAQATLQARLHLNVNIIHSVLSVPLLLPLELTLLNPSSSLPPAPGEAHIFIPLSAMELGFFAEARQGLYPGASGITGPRHAC